jgi:hypothetical protein
MEESASAPDNRMLGFMQAALTRSA